MNSKLFRQLSLQMSKRDGNSCQHERETWRSMKSGDDAFAIPLIIQCHPHRFCSLTELLLSMDDNLKSFYLFSLHLVSSLFEHRARHRLACEVNVASKKSPRAEEEEERSVHNDGNLFRESSKHESKQQSPFYHVSHFIDNIHRLR